MEEQLQSNRQSIASLTRDLDSLHKNSSAELSSYQNKISQEMQQLIADNATHTTQAKDKHQDEIVAIKLQMDHQNTEHTRKCELLESKLNGTYTYSVEDQHALVTN